MSNNNDMVGPALPPGINRNKRPAAQTFESNGNNVGGGELVVPAQKKQRSELVAFDLNNRIQVQKRTSSLLSPIMLLEGHQGEILDARFSPSGELIASGGSERTIFLWRTYGECTNSLFQPNHQGTITSLRFTTDSGLLLTSSVDKTVGIFDVGTGSRIKRLKGHTNFVNSVGENKKGSPLVVSGSDDCMVKVWDLRRRGSVVSLNSVYQVTAVTFGSDSETVISGGIDNELRVWDLRRAGLAFEPIKGHTDTITDIALSPDGGFALSNSMDGTLRIFDIKPFASSQRCQKIFIGHSHGFEKYLLKCAWAKDGQHVASGSSDRLVYIWNANTRQLIYRLPGHEGTVSSVDLHPDEPIVLSASVDKQIYLGELDFQ